METATISRIDECLKKLPREKLGVVYDFVSFLVEREVNQQASGYSEGFRTMLASEAILRRDWDRPEEDEAWADL